MNVAEKLVGAYLRLNGFLLLPHFTSFNGDQHNHIDLVAVRMAHSKEIVEETVLLTDGKLFKALSKLRKCNSKSEIIGVAVEIRTNKDRKKPTDDHIAYVKHFLGDVAVTRVAFYAGTHTVKVNGETLDVGMKYAGRWIQRRIDWMHRHRFALTKIGSWNWSEDFMSDILALRAIGLITGSVSAKEIAGHDLEPYA